MDKKDLNGNENLENNGTTEEDLNTSEIINEEVEVAQAAAEEPVNTTKADSIPVMNKVGANNATPPTPPTAPRSNKAWMIASIVLAAALIIVLVVQKDDSKKLLQQ